MAKHNHKGRSKSGPPFVQLHQYMMDSPAWRSLSPVDRAVYLEIARVYNGANNGSLARSVRQLSELCNINKDTASASLHRLIERGFIECAVPGGFSRKTRHAAEWRLTLYKCDRTGEAPSKAFMKWRSEIQNTVRKECSHGPLVSDSERQNSPECPLVSDREASFDPPHGPLVSDTYTSNHGERSELAANSAPPNRGAVLSPQHNADSTPFIRLTFGGGRERS